MYDIIESGSAEEIAAAAEAAVEKHDELFNLAMDEMSAWNSYADGTGAEDALKSAQAAMVDFSWKRVFLRMSLAEPWKRRTIF